MTWRYLLIAVVLSFLPIGSYSVVDFNSCLASLRNGSFGDIGLDSNGHPIAYAVANAISYRDCVEHCGAGQEPFIWSTFSQQFSSWLLPWLALVSQLPFGANDKLVNLEAVLLTVGSPTLAAYSLALTVLNQRWIARRFSGTCRYPNAANIVRVLTALQQSPLKVTTEHGLLASLIVLPHNDHWWKEVIEWLGFNYSWSISAATSITWVAVAFTFIVIDTFGSLTMSFGSNGQSVGSLWLWLLPIVVGWLQLSPKCDSIQLRKVIKRANATAYVASESGGLPIHAYELHTNERAIYLFSSAEDHIRVDEQRTPPVYNYARLMPWVRSVELIRGMCKTASERASRHEPVNMSEKWMFAKTKDTVDAENRTGSRLQVVEYCRPVEPSTKSTGLWQHEVLQRIVIASMLALLLQWGSTGAAVINAWLTPTRGVGCRVISCLFYGALSTIAWILLLTSSILSHYSTLASERCTSKTHVAGTISIILRRTGKVIAVINAIWIVILCMFQVTRVFDRCYCNSSVFELGKAAYAVLQLSAADIPPMRVGWIGAVALGAGTAIIFIGFVAILLGSPLPDEADH